MTHYTTVVNHIRDHTQQQSSLCFLRNIDMTQLKTHYCQEAIYFYYIHVLWCKQNICEFIIVLYFKCSNIFESILMMTFSSCTDTNWQINWKSVLRKHFGFSVFQLFTCHHNCFGKFSLLIFRVMYTLL